MKRILLAVMVSASVCFAAEPIAVWPPPPDAGRIQFEKFITKAGDFKITKSFFRKVWDFLAGNEEKVLIKPYGLKVANDGKILVADAGAGAVFIFDPKNNSMETIDGFRDQRLLSPIDVDTDESGNIYVSDSVLGAVFVFYPGGELKGHIGEGRLHRPTGIAIDHAAHRLYAADTLRSVIEVFDLNGTHLKTVGEFGTQKGEFNRPTFIALNAKGDLCVMDSMNHRVQILDREGSPLSAFGSLGDKAGSFGSPRGIAVDAEENIYVTDTLFNTLQIFNRDGELLMVMGEHGSGKGEFAMPGDIALGPEGEIYIADAYNMRVQHFKRLSVPKRSQQ